MMKWISLLADIATIFGVILVIIAVIPIIKNRLTSKTLTIIPIMRFRTCYDAHIDALVCDFSITNYTNKCFCIKEITFIINKEKYITYNVDCANNLDMQNKLKDIPVNAYQAFEIIGAIAVPDDMPLDITAKIEIKTTIRNIKQSRKILLPKSYQKD